MTRILVLEDDDRSRESLCRMLEKISDQITVDAAADLAGARLLLRSAVSFDLFLLDIHLNREEEEDRSGIWFAEEVRSMQQYEFTPLVMVTSSEEYPCPAPLSSICGSYSDNGYGDITIREEENGLSLDLGTLTLHGFHCRSQHFLFTEEHVLPGLELEAEAEIDRKGNVTAFLIALEPTDKEKIRFRHLIGIAGVCFVW